jgi:hypothetical protein
LVNEEGKMLRKVIAVAVAALAMTASLAAAQTKTITGNVETITASIEAIDTPNRTLTVRKTDGTYQSVYVPQDIKRFDQLKVGQKVSLRHYETVVFRVQPPGTKPVDEASRSTTPASQGTAGTVARQRTITATIAAIDPAVPSVTFTGPNGWKYSSRVQDKSLLSKVKVGDKVDITWTDATLVSVEDPK